MCIRIYKRLRIIPITVIFMAFFGGCASLSGIFSGESSFNQDDPIAREAYKARNSGDNQEDSYTDLSQEAERMQNDQKLRRNEEIQIGLAAHEVVLGMDMDQVLKVWGRPRDVETAGDPQLGNQKWTYHEGISSRWNIMTSRIVYFESGKVVGWETAN